MTFISQNPLIHPTLWSVLTGDFDSGHLSVHHPIRKLAQDLENWILCLLSAPAPVPGRSCVHLSLLPESVGQPPLVFALPDKTRLTLVDFPLHLPLELLGVETCLSVWIAIMLEQKVILQSRDYNALTMSCDGPNCNALPTTGAENLLLSPTPYLIGIPANFLKEKKPFVIPPDVCSKLEPIPSLPIQEGNELLKHLEQALATMNSVKANIATETVSIDSTQENYDSPTDDVDTVDVATRVAMIRFFNSANVLANLAEHTRTIRLFPRPVVAFQYYSFLKSRQNLTSFTRRLAQTQAVEYFAEWCLYPENEVFQRIHAGIHDPPLIGDKAKWFAHTLPQIQFEVWSEKWCSHLEVALRFAAGATLDEHSDTECVDRMGSLDQSSLYRPPLNLEDQLRNAVIPHVPVSTHKKTRPRNSIDNTQLDQYDSPLDVRALASQATVDQDHAIFDSSNSEETSSDLDDADIWDLKRIAQDETDGGFKKGGVDLQYSRVDSESILKDGPTSDEGWLEHSSGLEQGLEGFATANDKPSQSVALVVESTVDENQRESAMTSKSRSVSFIEEDKPVDHVDDIEEEDLEETSVGKMLLTNLSENLADAASQASSHLTEFLNTQKNIVKRSGNFARRVVIELKSDSPEKYDGRDTHNQYEAVEQPTVASKLFAKLTPKFQKRNKLNGTNQENDKVSANLSANPDQNLNDQAFLRNVTRMVLNGVKLSPAVTSRLRELSLDENFRSYLISKVNQGLLETLDDPEAHLPDQMLASQAVCDSFVQLLQCMLRGLEATCTNHGIGGLASAVMMLEVCHTHYIESPATQPPSGIGDRSEQFNSSENRRSSKQNDENLVGAVTDWFRSKKFIVSGPNKNNVDPIEKESRHGRGLTGQMASLFSRANQALSTTVEKRRPVGPTRQTQQQMDDQALSTTVEKRRPVGPTRQTQQQMDDQVDDKSDTFHTKQPSVTTEDRCSVQKSCVTGAYRFRNGQLIKWDTQPVSNDTGSISSNPSCRVYLYEALVRPKERSRLWDHMQFWEDTFFDTVAQERDILGLDQAPMAMLEQFSRLDATERKRLQNQEDRLITVCLYNLISFMVMMQVDKGAICTRVRRIQARCRLASSFSWTLSKLLDQLSYLDGNSIDLLPTMTRYNCSLSTCISDFSGSSEDVKYLEVFDKLLIFRDANDAVVKRWALSCISSVHLSSDERTLVITLSQSDQNTQTESFRCDKAKQTLTAIRQVMEKYSPAKDSGVCESADSACSTAHHSAV
ncbi:hypothetical protein AHF37_00691 [Paragonimus kellicotti]|nr:hypothetical protein AHF37_00691 [Paragonimus kellicotti]